MFISPEEEKKSLAAGAKRIDLKPFIMLDKSIDVTEVSYGQALRARRAAEKANTEDPEEGIKTFAKSVTGCIFPAGSLDPLSTEEILTVIRLGRISGKLLDTIREAAGLQKADAPGN